MAFDEWKIYFVENGFTYEMENWRAAMIASSNWNVTVGAAGAKGITPLSCDDFMPENSHAVTREYSDDELAIVGINAGGIHFDNNS